MPTDTGPTPPSEQAHALGEALRALRERAGITQEAAGEAMGVTRSAWGSYENGGKPVVLRTDMQERLAAAIGLTREDLIRERDRRAGGGAPQGFAETSARIYQLPVQGRSRATPDGPEIYDLSQPEGVADLSWIFSPSARALRMSGDRMSGYVESGQLVIYDTAIWPRRGEGCVIELTSGAVHVLEYVESGQGVLKARQRQPDEQVSFPMAEVRGCYVIRSRGG
jgi:transcriptional regulator with XRE-family HTH domain